MLINSDNQILGCATESMMASIVGDHKNLALFELEYTDKISLRVLCSLHGKKKYDLLFLQVTYGSLDTRLSLHSMCNFLKLTLICLNA